MQSKLRGTGVAIVTPFFADHRINFNALGNIVDYIIKGKCEYIVVLGTTGENVTLSNDEKQEVFSFVLNRAKKKIGLVAGVGGNNTNEVVSQLSNLNLEGYDAILSVSPYYNKPSQEGIYQHFITLAASSPLPIILYNVPSRTMSNITAETTIRLANASGKIIGIKEASGNLIQMMQIVQNRPKGFLVISGDDPLTLPCISFGMDGVISVAANAFPKETSKMVRAALAGKFSTAEKDHYKLLDVTELMFAEGNPCGVKEILSQMNLCESHVRLPLTSVSDSLKEKIRVELEEMSKS